MNLKGVVNNKLHRVDRPLLFIFMKFCQGGLVHGLPYQADETP